MEEMGRYKKECGMSSLLVKIQTQLRNNELC